MNVDLTTRATLLHHPASVNLQSFTDATVEDLNARALLKRTDTKFLFSRAQLDDVLASLARDFRIVRSGDAPFANYETVYFDTPEMTLFNCHRRGRRPRHKVRVRNYVERRLCFLEVKTKDNHDVTRKVRVERDFGAFTLSDGDRDHLEDLIGAFAHQLRPQIRLDFPRLTFVSTTSPERITLDLGLSIRGGDRLISFPHIVIAELKQERFRPRSVGMSAFRKRGIVAERMSKYCSGVCLANSTVRTHRFRLSLRELERHNHV